MSDSPLPSLSVFGLGYVGAVTAAGLAASGHRVTGVDVVPAKVAAVNAGVPPVAEAGLGERLAEARRAGRLTATCYAEEALARSDVSLVCVGTPPAPDGAPDLRFVRKVFAEIAGHVRTTGRAHTLCLRSTVQPGTTARLVEEFAADLVAQRRLEVLFLPEFLREGTALADFADPSVEVVGTADGSPPAGRLGRVISPRARIVDWATAELVKYACNAFHAAKVAFANEVGRIAAASGVDGRRVMDLLCADTRLNVSPAYLRPGGPFGGSCLPKDLRALLHHARRRGVEAALLESLLPSNAAQLEGILARIVRSGHEEVVLLGLSFKPGTDDLRDSPMVEVAQALVARGYRVRIFDPLVQPATCQGANRMAIEARLPQWESLLRPDLPAALGARGLVVISQRLPGPAPLHALLQPGHAILDLAGWTELRDAGRPYEGISW